MPPRCPPADGAMLTQILILTLLCVVTVRAVQPSYLGCFRAAALPSTR